MKDYIKLSGILLLICLVSSIMLSYVNNITSPVRKQILLQKEVLARKECYDLPGTFSESESFFKDIDIIPVFLNKKISGAVVKTSFQGFSGPITAIFGITVEGEIRGINILNHTETPGLGSKIEEVNQRVALRLKKNNDEMLIDRPYFLEQLRGFNYNNIVLDKDGGKVDSLTAATISSRAVANGIQNAARDFFEWLKQR